jgi:peptidoglycan hydrolase-like protein with peptidoglycan-binding domain
VVARGDSSFDGEVNLRVETSGLGTPAVVTGRVPAVGATLTEGTAALEITGRPVIALAGGLPMYRGLRPGTRGPDVMQLEQTLLRRKFAPGKVDGVYDTETGRAVARLFRACGYDPPTVDPQYGQATTQAKQQVEVAQAGVRAAERAFREATLGPSKAARVQADNAVEAAQRAVEQARGNPQAVAEANAQLELAKAQRSDLLAGKDVSVERAAVEDAKKRLGEAKAVLLNATPGFGGHICEESPASG